jgi:hypothetical protein
LIRFQTTRKTHTDTSEEEDLADEEEEEEEKESEEGGEVTMAPTPKMTTPMKKKATVVSHEPSSVENCPDHWAR